MTCLCFSRSDLSATVSGGVSAANCIVQARLGCCAGAGGGRTARVTQQQSLEGAIGQHQLELNMGGTLPPLLPPPTRLPLPLPPASAVFFGYMARCSWVIWLTELPGSGAAGCSCERHAHARLATDRVRIRMGGGA